MGKSSKRGGPVKAQPAHNPGPTPAVGRKIRPTPMTTEEYVQIAREVAREEIIHVAQALGKQVYDMVAKGVNLEPVVDRIDTCLAEQIRFNVVLNAIAELLIESGAFTREQLSAKADTIAEAAAKETQERHRTQVAKARQAREAGAAGGDGSEADGGDEASTE